MVVIWLFRIKPSHNFLGMVQHSCLALENSKSSNMVAFDFNFGNVPGTFSKTGLTLGMFSNSFENFKKQGSSVVISVLQHNVSSWFYLKSSSP